MKRRTRIISAVCAAALLGSAMTMPAAAYPMHMNGEAEVPLAQVLQMLEMTRRHMWKRAKACTMA